MTDISRTALFGKLNNLAYKGVESATVFCKMRGNSYVELAHWLHQILQLQDSDLHRIIKHFQLNPSVLARDFTDSLDRLPAGATSISDLSAHVEEAVEQGWLYASLKYGSNQVRTGHLVIGIIKTTDLRNGLHAISAEFKKINADTLLENLMTSFQVRQKMPCMHKMAVHWLVMQPLVRVQVPFRPHKWASKPHYSSFQLI